MSTQTHKSHVIDDVLEEMDNLFVCFGWIKRPEQVDIYRSDLSLVRKDVLIRLHEVLSEARRRLEA